MREKDSLLPFRDDRAGGALEFCGVCGREIYGAGAGCHYCGRFFS